DRSSGLKSGKIAQQRRHFVHAVIKFLIGDGDRWNVFRLADKDECGFIPVLLQVAIDAVVRHIELAADKPFPEGSITGVKRGVPVLVPGEQVSIFPEALGKILFAEPLIDGRISEIGLSDKRRAGMVILFFLPMDGYLGFS